MSIEELEFKEQKLRECFKEKLKYLNVEGDNDYCTVKCIKTYGVLWHLTHQLLMAEKEHEMLKKTKAVSDTETTAETMNIQATGLRMTGATK